MLRRPFCPGETLKDELAEMGVPPTAFTLQFDAPLNYRVEKMRLSRDRTQIRCNSFLALDGVLAAAFDYRLGNRSALEWVIDQYRVKTDRRSGIVNDPNRVENPRYIVNLLGKVIAVSLATVEIVAGLPGYGHEAEVS